jgi:hypothetical protein
MYTRMATVAAPLFAQLLLTHERHCVIMTLKLAVFNDDRVHTHLGRGAVPSSLGYSALTPCASGSLKHGSNTSQAAAAPPAVITTAAVCMCQLQ